MRRQSYAAAFRSALILIVAFTVSACGSGLRGMATVDNVWPIDGPVAVGRSETYVATINAAQQIEQNETWSSEASIRMTKFLTVALEEQGVNVVPIDWKVARFPPDQATLIGSMEQKMMRAAKQKKGEPLKVSVGERARTLRETLNADYLLFSTAFDVNSTTGRHLSTAAGVVLGAVVGIGYYNKSIPGEATAGLYDLRTGELVWINHIDTGGTTLRNERHVASIISSLLEGLPVSEDGVIDFNIPLHESGKSE